MSLKGALKKIRWSLAQRGVAGTLRMMVKQTIAWRDPESEPRQHPFDLEYGLDTGGLIGGGMLSIGHAHDVYITAYVGAPPSRFRASIHRWIDTPLLGQIEEYAFVDLGCGKGRAVLLASEMQFREVIGVELNPDLARVAKANVEIWNDRERALCLIRIVCADATDFDLPPGPCLIYLANPFGAPVMKRLLEKLVRRASTGGGVVDLVYQNPEQAEVFAEVPAIVRLWSDIIPISLDEAAADRVYTATDRCNAYRLLPKYL